MNPKLSLKYVTDVLKEVIPEYEEMLVFIEKRGGNFQFPPNINDVITRLKIDNYPELYRDESKLIKLLLLSSMPADQIKSSEEVITGLTGNEQVTALEDFTTQMTQNTNEFFDHIPETEEEKLIAQAFFDQMTQDEQSEAIKQTQISLSAFFATFFNIISMMVHGRKLTDLVPAGEAGDDHAYFLAVQIDKRILSLPYFRERRIKAELKQDLVFLKSLNYRLTNPLLRGKIRYRTLWLTFAFLDMLDYLDGSLTYSELLDLLDKIGIAGYGSRIEDENALGKRVREYRKFQKMNQTSRR